MKEKKFRRLQEENSKLTEEYTRINLNSDKHQVLSLETILQSVPKEALNFKFNDDSIWRMTQKSIINSFVNPLLLGISHIFICQNVSD
jgi:hypothetical protein